MVAATKLLKKYENKILGNYDYIFESIESWVNWGKMFDISTKFSYL